jgi:menaquinone-dependent protoporphyrinogen IX oxidase
MAMKHIVIIIVLLFSGDLEYRKFEYINNSTTDIEIILECSEYADVLREKISYHTWNYKNQGPRSHGWYLKDKSGMLIGHIC